MFLLSEMELRSQLKNMDRDSIFRMLLKHLERCETRLRYFEVTKSEVYKCKFTHAELQWLKKLTAAFSEESDSNDIIKTETYNNYYDIMKNYDVMKMNYKSSRHQKQSIIIVPLRRISHRRV